MDESALISLRFLYKSTSSRGNRDDGDGRMLLVEQPPHRQLIHTFNDQTFSVPLPWTYYGLYAYDYYKSARICSVTNTLTRIEKFTDTMYLSPYPNLNGGTVPCYPHHLVQGATMFERLVGTLHVFWDSQANPDYWRFGYYRACGVAEEMGGTGNENRNFYAFLKKWERHSIDDIMSLNWVRYCSVRHLIEGWMPLPVNEKAWKLIDRPFDSPAALD